MWLTMLPTDVVQVSILATFTESDSFPPMLPESSMQFKWGCDSLPLLLGFMLPCVPVASGRVNKDSSDWKFSGFHRYHLLEDSSSLRWTNNRLIDDHRTSSYWVIGRNWTNPGDNRMQINEGFLKKLSYLPECIQHPQMGNSGDVASPLLNPPVLCRTVTPCRDAHARFHPNSQFAASSVASVTYSGSKSIRAGDNNFPINNWPMCPPIISPQIY